jgi:hypothetical protein
VGEREGAHHEEPAKAMNLRHLRLPRRAVISAHSGPHHDGASTQRWARMPRRGHTMAPPSSESLHAAPPWIETGSNNKTCEGLQIS